MTATPAHKPWLVDYLLLAALWGASFLFMRLAAVEFGPLATAAVRVAIASAFLLPFLILRGQWPVLTTHWKKVFLIGFLNSGVPFACIGFALLSITSGMSAILNATVPMFGALVAWLWLKDRPTASRALGLLVGFAGVTMLAWPQASFKPGASGVAPGWAIMSSLIACLCYGLSASLAKRYFAGLPALTIATGSQMGSALGLVIPAALFWPAQMPGTTAWLAVLAVGVLCTGVAYVLYFRVIDAAGPARALTVTFVLPVFAIIYGALFLQEAVTPWMLVCGAVIVCGTALSTGLIRLRALG